MKLPANFYRPLAIGAPLPLRELPVRPERMIHFFPPHVGRTLQVACVGDKTAAFERSEWRACRLQPRNGHCR